MNLDRRVDRLLERMLKELMWRALAPADIKFMIRRSGLRGENARYAYAMLRNLAHHLSDERYTEHCSW